ncbi:MAG TPA: RasGEF domain-containing protein, partial [archaeon]|nr:RasGEF domain-containing protein [archaeon]
LKWKDLSEGTMIQVYGFLDSVARRSDLAELAQQQADLRAELDRTLALRQAMERNHASSLRAQPLPGLNTLVPLQFFLSTPETVLAEQLTLLDFEHYCAIQSSELLHQSWVNPEQRIECLGISALFERLNSLGHWVASMALLHDRKKARAALLSKVIRVGEALLALNNFNTLAGFIAGCCMAPVDRLRHSWKYVPKRDRELLGQFTQLLGPAKSYSAYRSAVRTRSPPICPYIGVSLSDLTLIDEGNPNLVDGGRINWQKRELESRVIGELLVYQNVPYSALQSNPAVAEYLVNLPCLPVAVLQDLSLAYEPRGVDSGDVL